MTRTKAKARRGPEGREYRENAKTLEGQKRNRENRKRKHDEREAAEALAQEQNGDLQLPPAKKNKKNKVAAREKQMEESLQSTSAIPPAPAESHESSASNSNTPHLLTELENTHEVTIMNIISSSQIQQKVTRTLEILSEYPAIAPAKPKVVMLHAKAPIASKLITIAEITKREVVKGGGKWFQYNKLGQIMEEKKSKEEKEKKEKNAGEDVSMAENKEEDRGNGSEEEFETMKTPFERAIEGKPKVRTVPVMTVYLSRVRIDSLRKEYR
jgi:hypothetical protein